MPLPQVNEFAELQIEDAMETLEEYHEADTVFEVAVAADNMATAIEDLIAALAGYRPDLAAEIDEFLTRMDRLKEGEESE